MSTEATNPVDRGTDLIAVLKEVVSKSGLSLNKIAKESGLSQSQLHRFVSGERTLSLASAAKLFDYFGLRVVVPEASADRYPIPTSASKKPKKK